MSTSKKKIFEIYIMHVISRRCPAIHEACSTFTTKL